MIATRRLFSPFGPGYFVAPWKLFNALQQEARRALHTIPRPEAPLRVYQSQEAVQVEVDAPGLTAEAFDIAPTRNTLVIQLTPPQETTEGRLLIHERTGGHPTRYELTLPFEIAADSLDAVYDKGVLRITAKPLVTAPTHVAVRTV